MTRVIINIAVGIFVLVMLILALGQGMATWGTGVLGVALGAMIVVIFPWHAAGPMSRNVSTALSWIGALILIALLVVGIATDWTNRETALMGIAAGAALAAALQRSTGKSL